MWRSAVEVSDHHARRFDMNPSVLLRLMLIASLVSTAGCARQNKGLKNITRRDLPKPEEIQNVPCDRFAVFFEDGTLLTCTLSRDAEVGEASLPAGTKVRFHEDGTLWYAFLPEDTEIEGHLCKGDGHNTMTGFYPSGRLQLCWLAEDQEIQGIPCVMATTSGEVFGRLAGRGGPGAVFYESGRLKSCKLSRDLEIGGRTYKKKRRIELDEDGNPRQP